MMRLSLCLSQWQLREGTCREGSYTKDSDRHAVERSENVAFFIGLYKGNLRHLARKGSATMFNGLGNCHLTGNSPGLLPASLLDITP